MIFDPELFLLEFDALETNGDDDFVLTKYAIHALDIRSVIKIARTDRHERLGIKSGIVINSGIKFAIRDEYHEALAVFKQVLKLRRNLDDAVTGRFEQDSKTKSTLDEIKRLVERSHEGKT